MSVEIPMIEFEKREAHLSSELEDGPPYTVHGVALGEGDVTRGSSGIEKYWPAEELKKAADTLEGRNLVEDHNNESRGVVGKVTKSGYKEGVGILYEAELYDEDLAEKISNGLLEVSIRGYHKDVDEMEENEDGAKVVEDIEFDNLSIVPNGASPSNTLEMGAAEELSVAALSEYVGDMSSTVERDVVQKVYVDSLEEVPDGAISHYTTEDGMFYYEELQEDDEEFEPEASDLVKWDGKYGVVISMPEDGEVEVDIYEEKDGRWRSTEEVEAVSVDDLEEWDVDEDDLGPVDEEEDDQEDPNREEEEDGEDEEDDEDEEEAAEIPDEYYFESEDDAEEFIEDNDGLTGVHEMDGQWMPGADHDEFIEWWEEQDGGERSDPEMKTPKSHHRETLELMKDFMTADAHEDTTPVSDFSEWADSTAVDEAVEEFSQLEGYSADSNMRDFKTWVYAILNVKEKSDKDEEEASRAEGEEETFGSSKERAEKSDESRNPDGAFDDEYEEASSADEGSSEESDVEELQEWEFHEVSWDGTTESEWSRPDKEDFDTDDLEEIGSHYLISQTGFPPENFTDLALPVVEPNGDLNVNALSAVKGGRGVSAVEGLSDDMEERIVDYVNNLANEHFDREWDSEENAVSAKDVPVKDAEPTHKMDPSVEDDRETEQADPVGCALDLINLYLRINGRNERDSVDKMLAWLFSSTDVPTRKLESFRTAANAFLDQQGGANSFDAVDVQSFRDWLLTQGGQTKNGTHARPTDGDESPPIATPVHVLSGDDLRSYGASKMNEELNSIEVYNNMTNIEEELEELDEPVAVEKDDLEELQEKADRMDEMSDTLASLKERTDVLDSVDSDKVEELAESDDPMVIESAEYEALSEEAEQVKSLYAEALSEDSPFDAEDYVEKFSIEELREKYEAAGGDLEEELSADPKSGDVDEEELEERAEEENQSEEELERSEEIESKQAELREKILGGNR